jgi:pimeloyl-ACP methyl ester carboxylesterase
MGQNMDSAIEHFEARFDDAAIQDAIQRLTQTRFPDAETVEDWQQGVPLSYCQELARYWREEYDWQRVPSLLNQYNNFITEIEGIKIHFLYIRSRHTQAQPLLITHGWPGSVLEFLDIIGPLSDPTQHGGDATNAFHLVIPSLPGFGFSGQPTSPGVGVERIAALWDQLMLRLGYERYIAQGGDWGSLVTHAVLLHPDTHCLAGHVNLPMVVPDELTMSGSDPAEQPTLAAAMHYQDHESGYSKQQSTRPQTLAYGLADSPAGQMAWIVEKYANWTDCVREGIRHPENAIERDVLLDIVTHYWMTNTGGSSARLYWESFTEGDYRPVALPIGLSLFPKELFVCTERLARTRYQQLVTFNDQHAVGGHFASLEQPEALIRDIRAWRAKLQEQELI